MSSREVIHYMSTQVNPKSEGGWPEGEWWYPFFSRTYFPLQIGMNPPTHPTHLQGVRALACAGGDGGSLDDLDAGEAHAVARAHLLVHLLHAAVERRVAVLLVHVVVPGPALVAHPDAEVLDRGGLLLKDLHGCDACQSDVRWALAAGHMADGSHWTAWCR